jgi:hypothetical protein
MFGSFNHEQDRQPTSGLGGTFHEFTRADLFPFTTPEPSAEEKLDYVYRRLRKQEADEQARQQFAFLDRRFPEPPELPTVRLVSVPRGAPFDMKSGRCCGAEAGERCENFPYKWHMASRRP